MSRMRLSTVFELLLIFIFIAFAASRHVGGKKNGLRKGALKQAEGAINPYCSCSALSCNCCRDFTFPIVSVKGPGCAAITYKNGDVLRLTMSFGNRVLRNITLVGKRPKPVCMGLPGGLSKFCGRLYNIERDGDKVHACLALELRALDDVEAALRLSCFKFGPDGVKLEPGQPIPTAKPTDEDDDDDEYDLEDDDEDLEDDDDDDDGDDEDNDVDSGDYTGFGALSDELLDSFFGTGGSGTTNKKKRPTTPKPSPIANAVTTQVTEASLPLSANAAINESTHQAVLESTTQHENMLIQNEELLSGQEIIDGEKVAHEMATTEMIAALETTSAEDQSTEAAERIVTDEDEDEEEEEEDEDEDNQSEEGEEQKTAQPVSGEQNDEDDDEDDEEEDDAETKEDEDDLNILEGLMGVVDGPEKEIEGERRRVDRMFPGLSALIKPQPSITQLADFPPVRSAREHRRMRLPPPGHTITSEDEDDLNILGVVNSPEKETEGERRRVDRMFPGLSALIKPQPSIAQLADFPPVRSSREHRRMRLPPPGHTITPVVYL